MADIYHALVEEFAELGIAREFFPMWTAWGVEDESVAVHSMGLSYLTTVGQQLGYACCCEYPVAGHKVRADSVWWDKATRAPVALFEFERHKGGGELREKVTNLLRACHSLKQEPELLCLVFWTKNFYPLSEQGLADLWQIFARGVSTGRQSVPAAPANRLRIFECLHEQAAPGRHVLKRIIERKRR